MVHVWAYPSTGGAPLFLGEAALGGSRTDIAAIFGNQFLNAGFGLTVRGLTPGFYRIAAYGRSTAAGAFTVAREVSVNATLNGRMAIDLPAGGVVLSPFRVTGWALDLAAGSGTGVDAVHVWASPPSGPPIFLGAASYGGSRPDVGSAFGTQFTSSAYDLVASGLTPGVYQILVFAHSALLNVFANLAVTTVTVGKGRVANLGEWGFQLRFSSPERAALPRFSSRSNSAPADRPRR